MIIEQAAPAGVSAWLAAVGLVAITPDPGPADPIERYELAEALGGAWPSVPSRWVRDARSGVWALEIDGEPAGFDQLLRWYELRFDAIDGELPWYGGHDPWWRTRGNSSPAGFGRAIYKALAKVDRPVDLVTELRVGGRALRTDALLGWVLDLHYVPKEDEAVDRPLIRYALAYVGATVAQRWNGHMIGAHAVGHLWDGQPGNHSTGDQTVIMWSPVSTSTRFPAWWGEGRYEQITGTTWRQLVRDRWPGLYWARELVTRAEAKAIADVDPGRPWLTRGGVDLWRRSEVLAAADAVGVEVGELPQRGVAVVPSPGARAVGDRPLEIAEVAAHAGLAVATLRSYLRDGRLPEPDGRMGRSQWWWTSTIDAWITARAAGS